MQNTRVEGINKQKKEAAAARAERSLELRNQGYTWEQIAKEQNVSMRTAIRDVDRALERFYERYFAKVKITIGVELARLDRLLEKAYQRAIEEADPGAVHTYCTLLDRKFKVLGVDKNGIEVNIGMPENSSFGEIGPETHARVLKVLDQYHGQLEFEKKKGEGEE